MSVYRPSIVNEIIATHPQCAPILARYRIDVRTHGSSSVEQACAAAGLDVEEVLAALEHAAAAVPPRGQRDITGLPTGALIDFILERHHGYLRRTLPHVVELSAEVAARNLDVQLFRELHAELRALKGHLESHLVAESEVLFPFLRCSNRPAEVFAALATSMRRDHDRIAARLTRIGALADGFAAPGRASEDQRELAAELIAMEQEILRQMRLEDRELLDRFDEPTRDARSA